MVAFMIRRLSMEEVIQLLLRYYGDLRVVNFYLSNESCFHKYKVDYIQMQTTNEGVVKDLIFFFQRKIFVHILNIYSYVGTPNVQGLSIIEYVTHSNKTRNKWYFS